MVSYLIAHAWIEGRDALQLLEDKESLPKQIISAICTSWVCNWTIPCVGAYVDTYTTMTTESHQQWQRSVHIMLGTGCVPIWICYGTTPRTITSPIWKDCMPQQFKVQSHTTYAIAQRDPEPLISVHKWLQVQAQRKADCIKYETPAQRTSREYLEQAQQQQPVPEEDGPRVFE